MEIKEFIRVTNAHAQRTGTIHNVIFFGKSARDDTDYLEAKRIYEKHIDEQLSELKDCLAKYGLDVQDQTEVEVLPLQRRKTTVPIQIGSRPSERPAVSTPVRAQPPQRPGPDATNQIEVEAQSPQQPGNIVPDQIQAPPLQGPGQFRYEIRVPKQKLNELESASRKKVFDEIEEILYSCDDENPPERPEDSETQILRIIRAPFTGDNSISVEHIENRDENIAEMCSICYLPIKDPETPTAPKCTHSFCRECLWYWFKTDLKQKRRLYLEQTPIVLQRRNPNRANSANSAERNQMVRYRNPYHDLFYNPHLECPYCRQKVTYQAYGSSYRWAFNFL